MACERFDHALNEHALGAAALDPAAAAHLAICDRCQAQLAQHHELARLIDGAIASMGAEAPPSDFRVRLGALIADRAMPKRYLGAGVSRGDMRRVVAVGSVAAALVVGFVVTSLRLREKPPSRTLTEISIASTADAASVAPGSPPVPTSATPAAAPVGPRVRPLRTRSGGTTAFDVLVPRGQRESLARLTLALGQHDAEVASRLLGRTAAARSGTADELTVADLVIDPVIVPAITLPPPILTEER